MARIGQVLTSKSGNDYIKLGNIPGAKNPFTSIVVTFQDGSTQELVEDAALFLKTPKDDLKSKVEAGFLTNEKAKEIFAKIPTFVKYIIDMPKAG